MAPARTEERAAATRLGAVYREIAATLVRSTPWIPPAPGRLGESNVELAVALARVYGTDTERERRYGHPNYKSRFDLYAADFRLVVPYVLPHVFDFYALALNAQRNALGALLKRLTGEPGLADRLHQDGAELVAAFAFEVRKLEAARMGAPPPTASQQPRQVGFSILLPEDLRDIVTNELPRHARCAADPAVEILLAHPDAMKIMGAYAESAAKGTLAATSRVRDAIVATEGMFREAMPFRYPAFIVGGVALRGLHDIDGFAEYAVAVCQQMVGSRKEKTIPAAQVALFALGVVLALAGGPAGVALAVLGSQLFLTGFEAGVTFMREHERELAYRAGAFRPEGGKFARPTHYEGTLQSLTTGAALLVSSVAHFSAPREVGMALHRPAAPAPPKEPPSLASQRGTARPPAASGDKPALDAEAIELMTERPQELAKMQRDDPFAGHGDATANKLIGDKARGIVAAKGAAHGNADVVASAPKFRIFGIPYGQGPLSRFAQMFRRLLGLSRGGNIAVFQFTEKVPEAFAEWVERRGLGATSRPGDLGAVGVDPAARYRSKVLVQGDLIAFENTASGGAHSEQFARDLIAEGRAQGFRLEVKRIYSELSPCARRAPHCLQTLRESFPSAEVTWSFPYDWGTDWPARNAAIDALFR